MKSVQEMVADLNKTWDNWDGPEEPIHAPKTNVEAPVGPPESINHPGGILEQFIEFTQRLSVNQLPTIVPVLAGLTLLGALCGQKFQTTTGLRTNLYCVVLLPSGLGKNSPLEATRSLLFSANALSILGPSHLASDATVFAMLKSTPVMILQIDEAGDMIASSRGNNQHNQISGLTSLLKEVWSCCNSVWVKKYASSDNDVIVPYPCLSAYLTGVPSRFWMGLNRSDSQDGFYPRLIVADLESPIVRNRGNRLSSPPSELIKSIRSLFELETFYVGDLSLTPQPRVMRMTTEAEKVYFEFDDNLATEQNKYMGSSDSREGLLARAGEKVLKIAMLHSISLALGGAPQFIEKSSILYAIDLIQWVNNHMAKKLDENVSSSPIEATKNRILKVLKAMPEVSTGQLYDFLKGTRKREMQEALEMLEESDKIYSNFNNKWRLNE